MIPLYREQLRKIRDCGIDVFVLPTPHSVTGMAWILEEDDNTAGFRVNIFGSVHSPLWLFVLYHEIAHHMLGHTSRRLLQPDWVIEYQTDQTALEMIAKAQPYAYKFCERFSKAHIRRLMQPMIDWEIWNHVDLEVADWAGCTVPDDFRAYLIEIQRPFKPKEGDGVVF